MENEKIKYEVKLDTSEFVEGQKKIKNTTKETNKTIEESNEKSGKSFSSLNGSMKKLALAGGGLYLLKKGLEVIVQLVKTSLKIFSEQEMAFRGLNKVAKAYSQDVSEASESAKKLSEDGLVPLTSSITTLKNLIGTGFSVAEALQIAEDMKTIGKFNRVVDDLGQAMEDSSKGIKTNSIELIENVGLTERLSTTMDKANVSIAKGINLSDNQAQRQAFLNSIRKQAIKFEEDGSTATETYSESVGKLNTAMKSLGNTFGKILAPAGKTVNKILTSATKATDDFLSGETQKKAVDVRREQLREYMINLSNSAKSERDLYQKREAQEKNFLEVQNANIEIEKLNLEAREGYISANEQKILELREVTLEKEIENTVRIREEKKVQAEKDFESQLAYEQAGQQMILDFIQTADEERITQQELINNNRQEKALKNVEIERENILTAYDKRMEFLANAQSDEDNSYEKSLEDKKKLNEKRLEIDKKYAFASKSIADELMKGGTKNINDLKKLVAEQVKITGQGKVIELTTQSITDLALSVSAAATGNYPKAGELAKSSGFALLQAGAISALIGGASKALGGGSSQTSTSSNNEANNQAQQVTNNATQTQSITYQVPDDSAIFKAMLPGLDQAARDGYNIKIISR